MGLEGIRGVRAKGPPAPQRRPGAQRAKESYGNEGGRAAGHDAVERLGTGRTERFPLREWRTGWRFRAQPNVICAYRVELGQVDAVTRFGLSLAAVPF